MDLNPLTDDTPQALLYLPGGTLLDHALHHVATLPVDETALVLQYRGDQIAAHLGSSHHHHLIPQHAPFTLLSALASAAPWVKEATLVLHADHYLAHSLRDSLATLDPTRPTFLLPPDDYRAERVTRAGAYLLPPAAFQLAAEMAEQNSLRPFFEALRARGHHPALAPLEGWSRHVDTPTDLLAVNQHLLTHWHEVLHPMDAGNHYDALNYTWIHPDAQVDRHSAHGLFVTVGPRARVTESQLYNALVLPGVTLQGLNKQNVVLAGDEAALLSLYAPTTQPTRTLA